MFFVVCQLWTKTFLEPNVMIRIGETILLILSSIFLIKSIVNDVKSKR